VPFDEIREGIRNGVRKVNIDTDIRLAMTGAMRRAMRNDPSVFDPRVFLTAAREATRDLCATRYEAFGAAGMADRIRPVSLDSMAARYRQ
jgi:fructose-bisphosphate aldolase class II